MIPTSNSIINTETEIPVFIGITEKAANDTESLLMKPTKISSMSEYYKYFGGVQLPKFMLSFELMTDSKQDNCLYKDDISIKYRLKAEPQGQMFTFCFNILMFFVNGGKTCYIVSLGDFSTGCLNKDIIKDKVFPKLKAIQDISIVVIPEAVYSEDCIEIYRSTMEYCEENNCFAILDIPYWENFSSNRFLVLMELWKRKGLHIKDVIDKFRNKIGDKHLSYAAAYFPWLETSVLTDENIFEDMFIWDCNNVPKLDKGNRLDMYLNEAFSKIASKKDGCIILDDDRINQMRKELHNVMLQTIPEYRLMIKKVRDILNFLPPSSALAGIYVNTDNTHGIWKAPADVSISYVNKISEQLSSHEQEYLISPMDGKSVNAICMVPYEGVKVWGARTLDGNSYNWRFINKRRAMMYLEKSIKNAVRDYEFESNDEKTWNSVKCMIENFLNNIWKGGGLLGYSSEDAYEVHVGLNDTMTIEDVQEGIMRITVLVAISHPAEFVELSFQQQMQERKNNRV